MALTPFSLDRTFWVRRKRSRSSSRWLAIVAALPLVAGATSVAGPTAVALTDSTYAAATPEEQIRASSPTDAELAAASPAKRVRLLVRCVALDGEQYCLHIGFTEGDTTDPAFWTELVDAVGEPASDTGGASLGSELDRMASLTEQQRADEEVTQVIDAKLAVGKVKLLRYYWGGEQPPADLFVQYPELQQLETQALADGGNLRMSEVESPCLIQALGMSRTR